MSTPAVQAKDTGLSSEDHYNDDDAVRMAQLAHNVSNASGPSDMLSEAEPPQEPEATQKKKGLEGMKSLAASLAEHVQHGVHKIHDVMHLNNDLNAEDKDVTLYPEVEWDAELRRTNTLHPEEIQYLSVRRRRIAQSGALARFLGLPEDEEVHPDDVPIIGLGGSGGGYRANLGFITVFMAAKELGFWDLISYLGAVSGSCWAVASYMTFGNRSPEALLDHFAASAFRHPLSSSAINAVADSPHGSDFLFGPLIQKVRTGVDLAILDLYSTFTMSYMWLPVGGRKEAGETQSALRPEWFQWSKVWERSGIKAGEEPFPFLTAVRHERPWDDWKSKTEPFESNDNASKEHEDAENAWWQWFEFNPLEMGCDELEGWVPSWAFGRKFNAGRTGTRIPEQSLSLILGLTTSAPAGPVSSYLAMIAAKLPHNMFGSAITGLGTDISHLAPEKVEHFEDHHPVHACNEPNPFFGAQQEPNRGQGIENSPRVHLIDSGMSNNMPTYSFTHPNRDVDVVLNCDYSSDVQNDAALARVNEFGKAKGLNFVPRVKLPPFGNQSTEDKPMTVEEITKKYKGKYAQVIDGTALYTRGQAPPKGFHYHPQEEGGDDEILYNARHQPQARRGLTMVYLPLLPNVIQPDYNPSTAPWSSSFNLVWTKEQVGKIQKTQMANIRDSVEVIRGVIREAYEKRKQDRLAGVKPFIPVV